MSPHQSMSTLVALRAAHHPETSPSYDRVVFEFTGPVPLIQVEYVNQLLGVGSGLPVPIAGNAILQVIMQPAHAHNDQGQSTVPSRKTFNLPNVKEVASAGDFEGLVTYGIGMDHQAQFRVITLGNASRVVVDVFN